MTRSGRPSTRLRRLTPKEIEVLQLVAQGVMLRDASVQLGLSDRGINGRVARLRVQSGRKKWSAITYWALTEMYLELPRQGLFKPPSSYIDVVRGLAEDKGQRQIATELFISKTTVADRIARARARVNARTEAQLVAIYWAEDWIS